MSAPKTVIVSGGTYGIGRGIVLDLARRGWHVVAFGLDGKQPGSAAADGIEGTRGALAAEGLKADVIKADVAEADAVAGAVEYALSLHGRIDGAVNNAALRPSGTILDTDASAVAFDHSARPQNG